MRYTFVTLFPHIVEGYFQDSILARAMETGHIQIDFKNPRDCTINRHNKVDEPMIGGGAGMLMTPQPLCDTLSSIHKDSPQAHVIFVTPAAKRFAQADAKRLATKEHIVFVSGRYEGVDERVVELCADEVFSIGDYVLTGGELPSMVLADSISRNIPGVLGNNSSLDEESFEDGLLEAPSFTKPDIYENLHTISEFSKGNHSKIADLKKQMSLCKTKYFRPDLYARAKVKDEK